jgi:hypothetical protein
MSIRQLSSFHISVAQVTTLIRAPADSPRAIHAPKKSLSLAQFIFTFSTYKAVMTSAHPNRRPELKAYEHAIVDMAARHPGNGFYDYHCQFSQHSASGSGDATFEAISRLGLSRLETILQNDQSIRIVSKEPSQSQSINPSGEPSPLQQADLTPLTENIEYPSTEPEPSQSQSINPASGESSPFSEKFYSDHCRHWRIGLI